MLGNKQLPFPLMKVATKDKLNFKYYEQEEISIISAKDDKLNSTFLFY